MSASDYFIYKKFSEFYNKNHENVPPPTSMKQREFGFFLFKERIMLRHKAFGSFRCLKSFLKDLVPSDVYYSSAYYENPEFEMDKKGWLGADLIFDIDADHLPTKCKKAHDEWVCHNCGFTGKGVTPEKCPICSGPRFKTKNWPCELCLDSAKNETIKLIEMLQQDFGFSKKEFKVFFSGHRGYHVHVENDIVKTLDPIARQDIVDYILGTGLLYSSPRKGRSSPQFFIPKEYGWGKRLLSGIRVFIRNATKSDLKKVGIKRNFSQILTKKDLIIRRCLDEGRWGSFSILNSRSWVKIADSIKDELSSKIDTVVTTDIHRLIRLNGTLHGKTGLRKIDFPPDDIKVFDPFKEAVAFKEGIVRVFVRSAPKFRLGGISYGPYKKEELELPTAAGILLVCKKRAEVLDQSVR